MCWFGIIWLVRSYYTVDREKNSVKKIGAGLADMPVKARATFWIFYAILTVYLFCIQYGQISIMGVFPVALSVVFNRLVSAR